MNAMIKIARALICGLALAMAAPAFPVQPDEMLSDPALEARAREISRSVRCPVCQGESIDDSNARISRDLRIIIRERLVAGDSDAQVLEFLVARYGEFILFDPPKQGVNLILWLAGPAMLLAGGAIAFAAMRRRAAVVAPDQGLSAEEQAQLNEILNR